MSKYDFENKIVWITGASSGLGFALAEEMVATCEHLFVTARNQDKLRRLFGDYSNVTILEGDITDVEVNRSIADQIDSQFGRLDCVIFNAGNAEYIDIWNFNYQPFERMMNTNFISMVKGIEVALPLLRKSCSPYLVGMSSSVAWQGLPQGQAYSASKAAIRNLFQGLRIELVQENIDV
ncbi:MAG: SDR family oxidoreductase, partial [Kangiellaceae bacterium]|nr:SDR family oxidoreductase [Kangiellaceae bacterium]